MNSIELLSLRSLGSPLRTLSVLVLALASNVGCAPKVVSRVETSVVEVPAPSASPVAPPVAPTKTKLEAACERIQNEHRASLEHAISDTKDENFPVTTPLLANLWSAVGHCIPAGSGAWAIQLFDGEVTAEVFGPPPHLNAILDIAFITSDGEKLDAPVPPSMSTFIVEPDYFDAPLLFDWDHDGVPEMYLRYHSDPFLYRGVGRDGPPVLSRIFALKQGKAEVYGPSAEIPIKAVRDVDGDGRPDILTFGLEANFFTTDGSPLLLAHATADGTFSMTDDVAREHGLRVCPSRPKKVVVFSSPGKLDRRATVHAAVCARLWGVDPTDEIARSVKQACPDPERDCPLDELSMAMKGAPALELSKPTPPRK
jgi:hypothetical protein